ncbi:HMA2 domain-containing protein [Halobacillus faecis]
MLTKVKQIIFMKRLEKMLAAYRIKIMHFIPGRVRISSPYWEGNSKIVSRLVPLLELEPKIISVKHTPETGTVLVEYDSSPDVDEKQIEQWFEIVQRVHNDVITREVSGS